MGDRAQVRAIGHWTSCGRLNGRLTSQAGTGSINPGTRGVGGARCPGGQGKLPGLEWLCASGVAWHTLQVWGVGLWGSCTRAKASTFPRVVTRLRPYRLRPVLTPVAV